MRPTRIALAVCAALVAVGLALLARDLLSWGDALDRGDRAYAETPRAARWAAQAWLPGDPAGALLDVQPELELRRALLSFVEAVDLPVGFDNGQRRAQARAEAEAALSRVAASGTPRAASQVANLVGVLAETERQGPTTDRGRAAFEAAVRADPSNAAAAYNLELVLRRARVVGSREGPGSGSGARGRAERGAGSGLPGEGY